MIGRSWMQIGAVISVFVVVDALGVPVVISMLNMCLYELISCFTVSHIRFRSVFIKSVSHIIIMVYIIMMMIIIITLQSVGYLTN